MKQGQLGSSVLKVINNIKDVTKAQGQITVQKPNQVVFVSSNNWLIYVVSKVQCVKCNNELFQLPATDIGETDKFEVLRFRRTLD